MSVGKDAAGTVRICTFGSSEEVGCSKLCLSTVDAMTRGLMICKHYRNIKVDQIWILFSRNLQPE